MIGAAKSDSVDCSDYRKCLCQLFTGEHICRNETGDYDTAGTYNPL